MSGPLHSRLAEVLGHIGQGTPAGEVMRLLVRQGLDQLPQPGRGRTLERWQCLATVAAFDLSLAKLYEGHTDAMAILAELAPAYPVEPEAIWGVWAAESPAARVRLKANSEDVAVVTLDGFKQWCSGASSGTHALLTSWPAHRDAASPTLVAVALRQAGIEVSEAGWQAVGMTGSASLDVHLRRVTGTRIGAEGAYLDRPGFWHGGAGVAACWYGGATVLAECLQRAVQAAAGRPDPLRESALGRVDVSLQATAALLRQAAHWIDDHPHDDARALATRVRLQVEQCARFVQDEVGRALGAGPLCRDARFARLAADLPVFIRQCHGDRDAAWLGVHLSADDHKMRSPWSLAP